MLRNILHNTNYNQTDDNDMISMRHNSTLDELNMLSASELASTHKEAASRMNELAAMDNRIAMSEGLTITTGTPGDGSMHPGAVEYNWGILALGLLIIASVVGNVLVCLAVCWEKRLQNMTNYFLMSLAIADLLVSVLVMPLGLVVELYGYFPLNEATCVIWSAMDVLMCTASIWHMSTMSMDRYFTLKYPMKYGRNKTKTMVVMKITFVWVVSICICSPVCVLGFINYRNVYNDGQCMPTIRDFVIYGSFFAFYVPLTVMLVTYALTIKILCDNQKLMKNVVRKQKEKIKKDPLCPPPNILLTPNASYSRISANHSADISLSYCASYNESQDQGVREQDEQIVTPPEPEEMETNTEQTEKQVPRLECVLQTYLSVSQPELFITNRSIRKTSTPFLDRKNGLLTPGPTIYVCKRQSHSLKLPSSTSHPHLSPFAANKPLRPDGENYTHRSLSESRDRSQTSSQPHLVARYKDSHHHHLSPLACPIGSAQSQPHLSPLACPIGSAHSQPHLPSMKRSRMLSSGGSNHSIKSSSLLHKSVTSVFELESVKNFDGCCVSGASSLNSMLSKGSNSKVWEDFEEPKMLVRLSQIESEMDECLDDKNDDEEEEDVFEEETEYIKAEESESEHESEDVCTTTLLQANNSIPINRCDGSNSRAESSIQQFDDSIRFDNAIIRLEEATGCDSSNTTDPAVAGSAKDLLPPITISSPPVSSRTSMDSCMSDRSCRMKHTHGSFSAQSNLTTSLSPNPSKRSSCVSLHRARSSLSIAKEDSSSKSEDEDEEEIKESTDELLSDTISQTTQSTTSTFHRFSPRMPTKVSMHPTGYATAWKTFLRRKKTNASFKVTAYCNAGISKRMATNEKKASKVLGIIFAVFVALWTPFFIVNVISVVCESCMSSISSPVMTSIVWLGYMSSLANPIIYTMFNTSFRKAFYRILTCKQRGYSKAKRIKSRPMDSYHQTNGSNWNSRQNTITANMT